jgi:hypothetical protein
MAGTPVGILLTITTSAGTPETITVDKWYRALSEPVRFKNILTAQIPPGVAIDPYFTALDPSPAKWAVQLSEPDGLIAMILEATLTAPLVPLAPPPPPVAPALIYVSADFVPDRPAMLGY